MHIACPTPPGVAESEPPFQNSATAVEECMTVATCHKFANLQLA